MKLSAPINSLQLGLFFGTIAIALLSFFYAFYTEDYYFAAAPFLVVIIYLAIINFKSIWYFLLFLMPFSIEIDLPGGFGTDIPTEPLMAGLMLVFILYFLSQYKKFNWEYFKNPLMVALIVHLFWIFVTALNSEVFFVSFKYMLAKGWYVLTFTFLTAVIIQNVDDVKKLFWVVFIPLTLTMLWTLGRHALLDFSFDDVNKPMRPFYRNHVNYAAALTLFYPFIFIAASWYKKGSFTRFTLNVFKVLYVVAIYLSFTRACMVALVGAGILYIILRWNLVKPTIYASVLFIGLVAFYFVNDNNFMHFAPTFEKTVHHDDFDKHLEATITGEDASSMERFYRWIAAGYMFKTRPVFGYGPGNFYPYYKGYTVHSFMTYLSDNEEGSTVHNYFLLLLVEQGFPGLIIFALLTFFFFFYGQKMYRQAVDPNIKGIIMAVILSQAVIYVNLIFSDLIEADKIGPIFFINIALLVVFGEKVKHNSASLSNSDLDLQSRSHG